MDNKDIQLGHASDVTAGYTVNINLDADASLSNKRSYSDVLTKDTQVGFPSISSSAKSAVGKTANINFETDAGNSNLQDVSSPSITVKQLATNTMKERHSNTQKSVSTKKSYSDVLTKDTQIDFPTISSSSTLAVKKTVNINFEADAGNSNPPDVSSPSITVKQVATNTKKERHSNTQKEKSLSNKKSYSDVLTKDIQIDFPTTSLSATSAVEKTANINFETGAGNSNPPLASSSSITDKQVATNFKKENHPNTQKSLSNKRSYSDILKSTSSKVERNLRESKGYQQVNTSLTLNTNKHQKSKNGKRDNRLKQQYKQSQETTRKGR